MNKKIGIYKITSPTGKVYIGESIDIYKRWGRYKTLNCKGQVKIYRSLLKYGVETHSFEIIEECEFDELKCRERYWQDFYEAIGEKGLNCFLTQTSDLKRVVSDETSKKLSLASKNRKGVSCSEEKKQKISLANTGKVHTNEARIKMSISQMKREKRSKEFCKQISERQMGGDNPQAKLVLDLITGIFYNIIKEASIALCINVSTLSAMLNGRLKNKTNLIFC